MRRLTVLVVLLAGCAPAGAADWPTFGGDLGRTGFSADTALTPSNAPGLTEVWRANLGATLDAQPAVADGVVVEGAEDGTLMALDATTGALRWQRRLPARVTACQDLPGGRYGISTTPVVQDGVVYAPGEDGRMYALSLATGATLPGWPVRFRRTKAERVWGAMALSRGLLYVATSSHCDNAYYRGEIVGISVRERRVRFRWFAVPRRHFGGGIWAWGGIALDSARRRLFVATGNAQHGPEAIGSAEQVVELGPGLRLVARNHPRIPTYGDADFGAHPVLIDAPGCAPLLAVIHKIGRLFLYDRRHVARGPVQTIQAGNRRKFDQDGTYAWSPAQRTLYLANATDGPLSHGMVALALGTDCRLHVRWQLPVDSTQYRPGPVTVTAGGLVVWGGGSSQRVWIADAAAGTLVAELGPLSQATFGGVTVVDGMVYVPAWDGRLHVFALR